MVISEEKGLWISNSKKNVQDSLGRHEVITKERVSSQYVIHLFFTNFNNFQALLLTIYQCPITTSNIHNQMGIC